MTIDIIAQRDEYHTDYYQVPRQASKAISLIDEWYLAQGYHDVEYKVRFWQKGTCPGEPQKLRRL